MPRRFAYATMIAALVVAAPSLVLSIPLPTSFSISASAPATRGGYTIEIAPDGTLWEFDAPGGIRVIDSIDGIFFNGNDVSSSLPGTTTQGVFFDQSGRLATYDTLIPGTLTLRNAVNGDFFDGDDTISTMPFEFVDQSGRLEPLNAAVGPDGLIYSTDFSFPGHLGVYDPTTLAFSIIDLSTPTVFLNRSMSVAFDPLGRMFLASGFDDVIIGIDSIDGVFFNGNDVSQKYDWLSIVGTVAGLSSIFDIAFDARGNLFVIDADQDTIYLLEPTTDQGPPVIPEPSSLILLVMGLIGIIGIDLRRRHHRPS